MPTVSQRIAKLTSEVNALREAASKFNVGDLVKPSTNYLRAIGPTTNKKDGIILGVIQNMRGYYIILWNDNDQPVAVAEGSLKMKKKNFKPNPHELRQKWKEYAFDPDSGGLMHKEDLAKKQKKASYVGTKVSHLKGADFLEELMNLPQPTPEEQRESAIRGAVNDGARRAWNSWSGHPGWRGWVSNHGGKWPSAKPAPGVKEYASFPLISDRSWRVLQKHGVRSPRDLGKEPVEIWFESEYRPDYDFYDKNKVIGSSRWTTGYGYTTGAGRKVYLRKGDMNSIRFAEDGLKKFLKTLM